MRRLGSAIALLLVVLLLGPPALAVASSLDSPSAADPTSYPRREGEDLLNLDTPMGRLEYVAGRGLRLGRTGFTLGGFTTVEGEALEGGERNGGLEDVNFFLFFDPVSWFHAFSEIQVEHVATLESGEHGIRSDPDVEVVRLYADVGRSDLLNVRVGKFLTPFGRWNLAPAEPLLWTTSDPLIVEETFDELSTGAMLWGATFPSGGVLSYSFYGSFFDPIAPDQEAPPARHSAGAHLEWASSGNLAMGASYFGSEGPGHDWNNMGGMDVLWRPHERVELSAEALLGKGPRSDRNMWGLYAQSVVEVVPTLYAIARYERYDPPARGATTIDLVDLGLAWVPVYYLRFKVDYRIADQSGELAAPGLRGSFSVLF